MKHQAASEVRAEDVCHHYGTSQTLTNVTLRVHPGEFLTVIGPSGSGKTTLLRIIGGLTSPTGGRVWIGQRDVTRAPTQARNVGFVFQNYALFPHLTVFDNIAYPLSLRRFPKPEINRRVLDALDLVQLAGLESRYPGQLSGGQQQRVALARATVFEPAVLLLDEPLGALDRRLRQQLGLELRRIQQQTGLTAIYVTHDQEEALVLSDRIAVINQGVICQLGAPDEVYSSPADRFVAEFLGQVNCFPGRVGSIAENSVLVRLSCGREIESSRPHSLQLGEEVSCIVRPERVRLNDPSGLGINQFTAIVQSVVFQGVLKHAVARTDNLAIMFQGLAENLAVREGDIVTVAWRPDDVLLFPGTPSR